MNDASAAWSASNPAPASWNAEKEAWRLSGSPDAHGRCFWDIDLSGGANPAGVLDFRYFPGNPDNVRAVTVHLRSGRGWHTLTLPAPGAQSGRLLLDPDSFAVAENNPGDWRRSDKIRISLWAENPGSPLSMYLEGLFWRLPSVAVVKPTQSSSNPSETAYGQRMAKDFFDRLTQLGVPSLFVSDDDLATRPFREIDLFVLPCNPNPPPAMTAGLKGFLKRGARLLVCYNSSAELGDSMGIDTGLFAPADRPGRWHSYSSPDSSLVIQHSRTPNLVTARAKPGQSEEIARWHDTEGTAQPEISWLRSPRHGWWHTAVFTREDYAAKQRFLLETIGGDWPAIWRLNAEHLSATGLKALLKDSSLRKSALETARLIDSGKFEQAVRTFWKLERKRFETVRNSLHNTRSPAAIGVWDHTGLGLHGGNWNATAPFLAEQGVRDVFLYRPARFGREAADEVLSHALDAAGRHGLNIHAWHICWSTAGRPTPLVNTWRDEGRLQKDIGGQERSWLCPSNPENRALEIESILRLAESSGLAGLHLDYIRYPDGQSCYCSTCRKHFENDSGIRVADWPEEVSSGKWNKAYRRWRVRQITSFVREFSVIARRRYPGLQLSAAVLPDISSARDTFGQDWPQWIEEGMLDFVCPMAYTENIAEFTRWWHHYTANIDTISRVRPGIGVTSNDSRLDAAGTARQIRFLVDEDVSGFLFFDLNFTLANEVLPYLGLPRLPRGRKHHE